ncbi:hypothetical protein HDU78_003180 [Chytriomyces hyalinus]|nr:hypothetical protein HDU78_003180 [Chytriomyces hyalinus]
MLCESFSTFTLSASITLRSTRANPVPVIINSLIAVLLGVSVFYVNQTDKAPFSTLTTETTVNAPIADVWAAIANLDSWKEWNRYEAFTGFNVSAHGPVPENQSGYIEFSLRGDGKYLTYPLTLDSVSHDSHFIQWTANVPVLLFARHSLKLDQVSETETRVTDVEHFWRLAAVLKLAGAENSLNQGMLAGLKSFVEGKSATPIPAVEEVVQQPESDASAQDLPVAQVESEPAL